MILPPPKKSAQGPPHNPFAQEVLARLPLAEAFYTVWGYLARDAVLDALFDRHRGRCYQGQLAFAELVGVLADAVTRYRGSGHRAIGQALQREQLATQARAVYGKLARLPLPLAEAFLAGLTARLRPLFPAGLYHTDLPASLAGLAVVVLDGKKIKKAAKRLLATRGRPGKPSPSPPTPTAKPTISAWCRARCRWRGPRSPARACGWPTASSVTSTSRRASAPTATTSCCASPSATVSPPTPAGPHARAPMPAAGRLPRSGAGWGRPAMAAAATCGG